MNLYNPLEQKSVQGCVCSGGGGACLAGGIHGWGMCGQGEHVWLGEGACVAGGVHGRWHVWQVCAWPGGGSCVARGCAWLRMCMTTDVHG